MALCTFHSTAKKTKKATREGVKNALTHRYNAFKDIAPTLVFHDHGHKGGKGLIVTGTAHKPVCMITGIPTPILMEIFESSGFIVVKQYTPNFLIGWVNEQQPSFLRSLNPQQRVSRYAGTQIVGSKKYLAGLMEAMRTRFPEDYDYHSKTFMYPSEETSLKVDYERELTTTGEKPVYIVKPESSSRGRGIYLIDDLRDIKESGGIIVQKYIDSPLLVHKKKLDIRIYVLVTSIEPLRVYLYHDGLVRFATHDYVPYSVLKGHEDLVQYTHLTNFSINKFSPEFKNPEGVDGNEESSKWRLHQLFEYIESENARAKESGARLPYEGFTARSMWSQIKEIVKKTMAAAQIYLLEMYNGETVSKPFEDLQKICHVSGDSESIRQQEERNVEENKIFTYKTNKMPFELLGFDLMFDSWGKAYLIEVNITPATGVRSALDRDLKQGMLESMFDIIGLSGSCGVCYDSAFKGVGADCVLKESIAEFYRTIGTKWERAYPDNSSESLRFLGKPTEADKQLMQWCIDTAMGKDTFTGALSTVYEPAKNVLIQNEKRIMRGSREASNHGPK